VARVPNQNKDATQNDDPSQTTAPDPAWSARRLLRAARVGTLATSANGHPFASLVTPACAPDLSILMLLSRLSPHTRHLMADPRCSILVAGMAETANPQTTPRVTVSGTAEVLQDPGAKSRFLAIHPYAALYADFGDFSLFRLTPTEAQFVGGFARAHRLGAAALLPDAEAVTAIAAAEDGILAHCNQDHPDALAAIAASLGVWRMVTADTDGFDLAQDETVRRFAWSAPVTSATDIRTELVAMTKAARTTPREAN
jgi:heme iron utilization protein